MRALIGTGLLLATFAATPVHAGRGATPNSVLAALRTNDPSTIIAELERAERLVAPGLFAPVMQLLDDDRYEVREVAAWWIGKRAAQRAQVRDLMTTRLHGADSRLARNAAEVLGTFRHPDALPALTQALSRTDLDDEARTAVARAIGTIGHPAGATALVASFADPAGSVRVAALEGYYALRGTRDGEPVIARLVDPEVAVRRTASAVLASLRTPSARAALEAALAQDADSFVRRNAARGLGVIGDVGSREVLRAASLGDASSLVRSVAKAALAELR